MFEWTWDFVFIQVWWGDRSGDDFHLKDSMLFPVPQSKGHAMPCRAMQRSTSDSQEAKGVREMGQKPFLRFSWKEMGESE